MAIGTEPILVVDLGQPVFTYGDFDAVNAVTLVKTPTDPTSPTVKYEKPDGVTFIERVFPTDGSIIRISAGRYYDLLVPDVAGVWWVKWSGTGAAQGKTEYCIRVLESQVP